MPGIEGTGKRKITSEDMRRAEDLVRRQPAGSQRAENAERIAGAIYDKKAQRDRDSRNPLEGMFDRGDA